MVKNSLSNAGDVGLIPGRGTKILHAAGQLSPHATTTEHACSRAHVPQLETLRAATTEPHMLWSPCATTRESHALQLGRSPQ